MTPRHDFLVKAENKNAMKLTKQCRLCPKKMLASKTHPTQNMYRVYQQKSQQPERPQFNRITKD
jgi:hypothetical protein